MRLGALLISSLYSKCVNCTYLFTLIADDYFNKKNRNDNGHNSNINQNDNNDYKYNKPIGAILGHGTASIIAVLGGAILSKYVSDRTLRYNKV